MQLRGEKAERDRVMERSLRTAGFAQALLASMESPAPLSSITQEVASLVGGESAALWRLEQGGAMVRMVAAHGLRSTEFLPLPLGQGLAGTVAQSSTPLSIEDAPSDPRCLFPREAKESGIGSYLGAPLVADGETLGVVEVHTSRPHAWSEEDSLILQSAASLVAEVLKSTDARGNRLKVESAYLGLSEALQRLRSREEVMSAAVEVLGHALGVSRAIVVEFDDEGRAAPVNYEYRMPTAKSALGATLDPAAARQALEAVATGEPFEAPDAPAKSLMGADLASDLETLSEVALPLRLEGKTRALIFLHQCDRARQWHTDEIEFADRVSRQLALSLSNVKAIDSAARGAQTASSRIGELEAHLSQLQQALAEARAASAEAPLAPDQLKAEAAEARCDGRDGAPRGIAGARRMRPLERGPGEAQALVTAVAGDQPAQERVHRQRRPRAGSVASDRARFRRTDSARHVRPSDGRAAPGNARPSRLGEAHAERHRMADRVRLDKVAAA